MIRLTPRQERDLAILDMQVRWFGKFFARQAERIVNADNDGSGDRPPAA